MRAAQTNASPKSGDLASILTKSNEKRTNALTSPNYINGNNKLPIKKAYIKGKKDYCRSGN